MAAPLRRRRLARTLQELRERTDLNVTEAAKLAGFSQAKLSRIETAQIAISGDDTFALCEVLGVAEDVTDALVALARQAKRRDCNTAFPANRPTNSNNELLYAWRGSSTSRPPARRGGKAKRLAATTPVSR
jgi:transcriptional regulator with XRE-family HTH domain